MKLTKTQAKLLQKAANNHYNGAVGVIFGYYTSRRGCPSYGSREFDAATKLVSLGLLSRGVTHSGIHQISHQFGADHYNDTSFYITDAGREFIAAK